MADPSDIVTRFQEQARRRPSAPALAWRQEEISYAALAAATDRAYAAVRELPAGPVGLLTAKSPAAVALVLALLRTARPVVIPSATLPAPTLRTLFTRAGCAAVLTADAGPPATRVDHVLGAPPTPGTVPPGSGARSGPDGAALADASFVLTTSGSTGVPKLVPLPRDGVARFVAWAGATFDLGPGRRVLNYAPLNFDLCLLDVWATLAHGGCAVLVPGDQATQPGYLLDLLDAGDVHVIQAVPMYYELLLAAARGTGRRYAAAAHVVVTGDVIRPDSLAALRQLFDRATVYNLYGCTETNDSFLHPVSPGAPLPDPLPLGRPLPGVDAVLVGADGRVVEGPGVGELYVATPFQAHGYLDAPDAGDRFVSHPTGASDRRYFRSGDLVARDAAGALTLRGRTDSHVKVRGQRVNLAEVERVLAAHDQVVEAAVVTTADRLGGTALHATVRRAPGSRLNSLVLRRHCADHLPGAAIPAILHIADDPLPRTSTGKVDRTSIRNAQTKVA